VNYKGKRASTDTTCRWNVKVDTIIGHRVSLKENIPVSKFRYDLTGFAKELGHNNDFSYRNS
jgi:hypothetical protein